MDTKELSRLVRQAEAEVEMAAMTAFKHLADAGVSIKDFSVGGEVLSKVDGQRVLFCAHCTIDVDWRYP